jgi:hypothetical protein
VDYQELLAARCNAEFAEKDKGQSGIGRLADLAALSQDIFTVGTYDLPKTESIRTMLNGKVVYDVGGSANTWLNFATRLLSQ